MFDCGHQWYLEVGMRIVLDVFPLDDASLSQFYFSPCFFMEECCCFWWCCRYVWSSLNSLLQMFFCPLLTTLDWAAFGSITQQGQESWMVLDGWIWLHLATKHFLVLTLDVQEFGRCSSGIWFLFGFCCWVCCSVIVVFAGDWGILWVSSFCTVLDGVFSMSDVKDCIFMLLCWCLCSVSFWLRKETIFLFVFSVIFGCNHCVSTNGVLPSSAH